MKSKIISLILCFIVTFFCLTGCVNYEGYKRVDIPNEQLGSVMLPENWEIISQEGWMTIFDAETKEIVAEELTHGCFYSIGGNYTDERVYNPKYSDYVLLEGITGSGNSNCGQYSIRKYNNGQSDVELKILYFFGRDSNYCSEFCMVQDVSIDVLSKIAKSYIRPQEG